ncbi:MAG: hypothetical protein R3E77_09435 [Steroidobacteraceae bacterium]
MSSTQERFRRATLILARSGSIKNRLQQAYATQLEDLEPDEVPSVIREDLEALHRDLRRARPLPGEDAVRATIRKLSESEADELAATVVGMYGRVSEIQAVLRFDNQLPRAHVQLVAAEA